MNMVILVDQFSIMIMARRKLLVLYLLVPDNIWAVLFHFVI